MTKHFLANMFCILTGITLHAQKPVPLNYPKGYFRYPLALEPRLNANFGEMRPNHFHMGLDLYTQKKENQPIYAAADGYISRVKIEAGGFGNAIYITHPNGLSTLYAHMNDFMPALQRYVVKEQYDNETWDIDLNIPASIFPVKKGEFIGYSGNTGGSQGPHVHFEIRETASEKCLNPLLFGFNIPDNVPPDIYRIALYNRNISVYEQEPMVLPATKSTQGYTVRPARLNYDNVTIAIQATDRMTGIPNSNGIYTATLYEKDKPLAGFRIDRIGYDQTRYLNAHIDYKTRLSGGSYLQFLVPLPGDKLDIYQGTSDGYLKLRDSTWHEYRIEVKDAYGNKSNLIFSIQASPAGTPSVKDSDPLMRSGETNVYETADMQVFLPETLLYDSIHFRYAKSAGGQPLSFSPLHILESPAVPLHDNFILRIKPDKIIPYNLRDRIIVKKITRDDVSVKKGIWELGQYAAKFREFGSFQLVADDQPPVISGIITGANLARASKISIYVSDNYDQVKNFRAELDGRWLRFVQRGNGFTYIFDEHCPRGEHELKISVDDEAGNKTTNTYRFSR